MLTRGLGLYLPVFVFISICVYQFCVIRVPKHIKEYCVNPLPHMKNLTSSNSRAIKDTMSKIWTNGDIQLSD